MATVKIEVVAGGQTMTDDRTVSADHLVRFVAALRHALAMGPGPTDLQVLQAWSGVVFNRARELTKDYERGVASASVADIDFAG